MNLLRVPRIGRYVAVGVVNTTVSTVLFLVLHGEGVDVSLAGALGFLAGALTSYVLNRAWTFGDGERSHRTTAWRFAIVTLVGLGLTAFLLRVAVKGFGMPPLPGQLVTVVLVTGVTYVLSRRWAFAEGAPAFPRVPPELVGLLVLAAVLNLWALDRNGWANLFYSAATHSMVGNWHDFLWTSFDRNGVMSIDKPPLSLWIQGISARTFGLHPLSVLVPQALMGVATVGLVYDLTRRVWGRAAGGIAGVVLALTPITVALSRHNNPDALLILLSIGAVWCVVRGLAHGRIGWLLGAAVCVGLGFETKMAAALLIVPGIALAWFWVAPRGRRIAVTQLLAAGAIVVVLGGVWMTAVALTPAGSRPWIGGTSDNSAFSLAFGYNGVGRIGGQAGGPQSLSSLNSAANANRLTGVFGGTPGAARLVDPTLGPQIGWLIPFGIVGGLLVLALSRLRRRDERTGWLIAVGGSFAVIGLVFSTAEGIFHPYYVSLLAPFSAAMVGAGAAAMVRRRPAAIVLAPLAVVAAAGAEVLILRRPDVLLSGWAPAVVVVCAVCAVALLALREQRWRWTALAAALAVLLVAPGAWAVTTLDHPTASIFPIGGPRKTAVPAVPRLASTRGGTAGRAHHPSHRRRAARPANAGVLDPAMASSIRFARGHGGGPVGVMSQNAAAPFVIRGDDIVGLGGFSGHESTPTVSWFADTVAAGRVRWILLNGKQQPEMERVVRAACPFVIVANGHKEPRRLYDCQGRAAALRAAATLPPNAIVDVLRPATSASHRAPPRSR